MDALWPWLLMALVQARGGTRGGPFFWFWLAVIAVLLFLFVGRFISRERKGPPDLRVPPK